jgi:hypothetical protein
MHPARLRKQHKQHDIRTSDRHPQNAENHEESGSWNQANQETEQRGSH